MATHEFLYRVIRYSLCRSQKRVFEAVLKVGNDKLNWPAWKGSKHEPQVSLLSDIKSMQGKRISENR
jgi:hypothetical protein